MSAPRLLRSPHLYLCTSTALALGVIYRIVDAALLSTAFMTGWLLLVAVAFTALYGARKRLPMLPLGSAATWLQLHLASGSLAVLTFALHAGFDLPQGWLESALWIAFVIVAASGFVGLYWSRALPRRLAHSGIEVIFERIPGFMFKLREEVERCVLEAAQSTGSSLLGDHYRDELASWFEGPADLWTHFRSRHAAGAARLRKIDALARYTSDAERPYHAELRKLTERKIALDQHYALQLVLKYWAFVHVPLTGALLVLVALHVLVAHAFSGGS